ncbi:MAG: AAA family ATPase, partial [Planctomycetaceae bacterium]|nr:AAA family ATPase [Planctomycetaceae bacterium]
MDEQHTAQGDEADLKSVEELAAVRQRILGEVRKTIVGQETVIEELLIAMLAGGHCLLVGVPGLAKTLMVRSLAETLSLSF